MPDDKEFLLPDDLDSRPALAGVVTDRSTAVPAPLVVVQYRRPGVLSRLTPPLLILTIAVALTAYHRKAPTILVATANPEPSQATERPSLPQPARATLKDEVVASKGRDVTTSRPPMLETPPPAAVVGPAEVQPSRGSADVTLPILPIVPAPVEGQAASAGLSTAPLSEETAGVATERPATAAQSLFEIGPGDGLRQVQPGEVPNPGPLKAIPPAVVALPMEEADTAEAAVNPVVQAGGAGTVAAPGGIAEPDKDAILGDIEREAAAIQDQRKNFEELKPRAQEMLAAETISRIQSERTTFRSELRELLKAPGPDLGTRIDALLGRYGRNPPPQVMAAYYRLLRTAPKRLTRQAEVELMRLAGLPEPMILDFLANKLHRTLNTRGGPRDANEVRVRAAQLLLSIPLGSPTNRVAAPVARVSGSSRSSAATMP